MIIYRTLTLCVPQFVGGPLDLEALGLILYPCQKKTIIRKTLPAKSNIFVLNKTENTYKFFSSDY